VVEIGPVGCGTHWEGGAGAGGEEGADGCGGVGWVLEPLKKDLLKTQVSRVVAG
jgi:hypothetical protein